MHRVAVGKTRPVYNEDPPYHPAGDFPELPFKDRSESENHPYELCRALLEKSGYDSAHFGTPAWNPLGHLCKPGQTVLIKPNFVNNRNESGDDLFAVVTHPSILRAAVDYVYIALRGEGQILIADAPQMDCDWNQLMALLRLDEVVQYYRSRLGFEIELLDLRDFALKDSSLLAFSSNRIPRKGDPAGHVIINLGAASKFHNQANEHLYYGADFDRSHTILHHSGYTQEYAISRSVLAADLFISLPKMKVHKKVGVTLNLKGLVGINTDKNCLIHYRLGSPAQGGDEIPEDTPHSEQRLLRWQRSMADRWLASQSREGELLYKLAAQVYRRFLYPFWRISPDTRIHEGGNWHGNDTAWRMVADLYRILLFADSSGVLRSQPQRRILCMVDGVVGGEKEGPLAPTAKRSGCVVIGENPLAVDLVATRLMGLDIRKIKQFTTYFNETVPGGLNVENDVEIIGSGLPREGKCFFDPKYQDRLLNFEPHPGWKGHIEV